MSFGAITKDETGNQSRRHEAGAGIRIVDEIAHDDGVAHEDVRRDEAVLSEPKELSFNMLLCWCIGKTASKIEEFFMVPGEDKMYKFDPLAIGPVVANCTGGINYCEMCVPI